MLCDNTIGKRSRRERYHTVALHYVVLSLSLYLSFLFSPSYWTVKSTALWNSNLDAVPCSTIQYNEYPRSTKNIQQSLWIRSSQCSTIPELFSPWFILLHKCCSCRCVVNWRSLEQISKILLIIFQTAFMVLFKFVFTYTPSTSRSWSIISRCFAFASQMIKPKAGI